MIFLYILKIFFTMLHLKIFLKYWIILDVLRILLCVTSPSGTNIKTECEKCTYKLVGSIIKLRLKKIQTTRCRKIFILFSLYPLWVLATLFLLVKIIFNVTFSEAPGNTNEIGQRLRGISPVTTPNVNL